MLQVYLIFLQANPILASTNNLLPNDGIFIEISCPANLVPINAKSI